MDVLWVALLILWAIVEGIQYFRKIPFPRRMIAPLVVVVCVSGLIAVGQAPQEAERKDALLFIAGSLMAGVAGSLFYGIRLILAKIWTKTVTREDAELHTNNAHSASNKFPTAKRIIFSIALVLVAFASIALAFAAVTEFQDWQKKIAWKASQDAHHALEDAVVITAYLPKTGCEQSYPYAYQIENKSNRVVNRVEFDVLVRKIGFSKILNHRDGYPAFNDDKILNPGDVWARCVRLNLAGYPYVSGNVVDKDVEFEIAAKKVDFK